MKLLAAKERAIIAIALLTAIVTAIMTAAHVTPVLTFIVSAISLATLASMVGMATEQLGKRMSAGATGVLQSALGNLPELMVGIFSLRAGLVTVVQSALVGSILANALLVLGLAFLAGGLKNGTQRFSKEQPRMIATLMLLAVSAIIMPTLAAKLHTAASAHIGDLSIAVSVVLLIVFIASIPVSLKGSDPVNCEVLEEEDHGPAWPTWMAAAILVVAGVASALVSDWFVEAMKPAITTLHISETFTGLVIVAIAGNAVENVVGIQLAIKNQADYAVSVILNSGLQVALGLTPVLVLLSFVIGAPVHLTLVMPPLLVAALLLSTLIGLVIVYDGESIWLEGLALIGLYVIIAAGFWWG